VGRSDRLLWGVHGMEFSYTITADEFNAGQVLYHKMKRGKRRFADVAVGIAIAVFFMAVALSEPRLSWAPILLSAMALQYLYAALVNLFPILYVRTKYKQANLHGKTYKAVVNEEGMDITGDVCGWHIRWPGVQLKAENDKVFMFLAANTLFIFGKQYLDESQQQEMRKLSELN